MFYKLKKTLQQLLFFFRPTTFVGKQCSWTPNTSKDVRLSLCLKGKIEWREVDAGNLKLNHINLDCTHTINHSLTLHTLHTQVLSQQLYGQTFNQ